MTSIQKPTTAKQEKQTALNMATNPKEPALTCSEVVERLAAEIEQLVRSPYKSGRDVPLELKLREILHSWRERRVQELEEALRPFARFVDQIERDESDDMHACFFHVRFGDVRKAAEALANSEQTG